MAYIFTVWAASYVYVGISDSCIELRRAMNSVIVQIMGVSFRLFGTRAPEWRRLYLVNKSFILPARLRTLGASRSRALKTQRRNWRERHDRIGFVARGAVPLGGSCASALIRGVDLHARIGAGRVVPARDRVSQSIRRRIHAFGHKNCDSPGIESVMTRSFSLPMTSSAPPKISLASRCS